MIGVSLRSLLSHKLRLALTTIAVILGVSFVAGTFILTDTINATFTSIFATANEGVAVTVHGHPIAGSSGGIGGGQNHPVPTSLLVTVRAVPGVKDAVRAEIRRAGRRWSEPPSTNLVADHRPRGSGCQGCRRQHLPLGSDAHRPQRQAHRWQRSAHLRRQLDHRQRHLAISAAQRDATGTARRCRHRRGHGREE